MFKFIKRLLSGNNPDKNNKNNAQQSLNKSLTHNLAIFKEIFCDDETIVFRELETAKGVKASLIFVSSMVDKKILNHDLIKPLMRFSHHEKLFGEDAIDQLQNKVIVTHDLKRSKEIDVMVGSVLYGDTLVLIEGVDEGLIVDTKGWLSRSIDEPNSEKVVRGPRDGFIEALNVNLSLIRRRLKNPKLKFKFMEVGRRTRTRICICYIEGLASDKILAEVWRRLDEVEIDSVIESGYIEEMIKDSPFLPIKTIGYTERPDIVVGKILEGRIAILVEGTPFALTLPYLFQEGFQSNEDYYKNYILSSLNRFLRYIAFVFSSSIPAIYLALVTYHQEMVPTPLILSISAARQCIPFPSLVELILLGLIFELLREGGVRLPAPIGQAISIVGAIILGDAAVNARLVSAPVIIVTALTGISGFLIPQLLGLVIILRIFFILLASVFGLYGYAFGLLAVLIQLFSMRTFGVPYMTNWGSLDPQEIKDTVIRAPWWYMYLRPRLFGQNDLTRRSDTKLPERR